MPSFSGGTSIPFPLAEARKSRREPVVAVSHDASVTDRDEREEALGAPKDAAELVDGMVGVAPLEGPNYHGWNE